MFVVAYEGDRVSDGRFPATGRTREKKNILRIACFGQKTNNSGQDISSGGVQASERFVIRCIWYER